MLRSLTAALMVLGMGAPVLAASKSRVRTAPDAVRVDGTMLASLGAGPLARELERRISGYLVGQSLPAGTVLRLKSVSLAVSPMGGGDDSGPGAVSDYLDCELVVAGVARPLLIAAPADAAGPDYLPDHIERRIDLLAKFTAGWVAKVATER